MEFHKDIKKISTGVQNGWKCRKARFYVFCLFTPLYRCFRLPRVPQREELFELYRLISKILHFMPSGSVSKIYAKIKALRMLHPRPGMLARLSWLPDWPDWVFFQIARLCVARLLQIGSFARLPDWHSQIGARLASTTQLYTPRGLENMVKAKIENS